MKSIALATVFVLSGIAVAAAGQGAGHTMITPNDLKWVDVPSLPPGAKLAVIEGPPSEAVPFTFRLKLPANYRVPPHWHPAVERVTVLSGTFHMGLGETFDRGKAMALTAGSLGMMQPKTVHYAFTDVETVLQLHGTGPWGITYVNPKDDPRAKK